MILILICLAFCADGFVLAVLQVHDAVARGKDPAETRAGRLSVPGCLQPALRTRSAPGTQGRTRSTAP